jgi:glutathione synthase/RimK-type ligase-like ATP-grasp enzyme
MLRSEKSRVKLNGDKTLINWGSSKIPYDTSELKLILNKPEAVGNATNKRTFFELCQENGNVTIPEFTTRKVEAEDWLRDNNLLFARTILQGSGGEGIQEISNRDDLGRLPEGTLLVKYIKKKREYRVHVADGKVIDVQEKRKRTKTPLDQINWRIRNSANGFVFCRQEVKCPDSVVEQAILAFNLTGLDFGAVDVIYNERQQRAYVLEVNTAPGLEGSTLISYQKYFRDKLGLKTATLNDHYDVLEFAERHGITIERN